MALCFDRGVLPVPLLWHAHRSAAVSSVYDGRRTICLTVAKRAADGRRTTNHTSKLQNHNNQKGGALQLLRLSFRL